MSSEEECKQVLNEGLSTVRERLLEAKESRRQLRREEEKRKAELVPYVYGTKASMIIVDDVIVKDDVINMECVIEAKDCYQYKSYDLASPVDWYKVTTTDCLVTSPTVVTARTSCVKEEAQKEPTMFNATKSHFSDRVYTVQLQKNEEARDYFHISEDPRPTSAQELIDRITAGKFTLPKDPTIRTSYPWDKIIWRDPKVIPDTEGYAAFKVKLDTAHMLAYDEVAAAGEDGAKMLAALQKLQDLSVA